MNPFKSFIIGSWLATAGILSAQSVPVPTAPSNLRVTVLGMNAFLMEWKDNSSNEKGWEIRVSLGKTSTPNRFQFLNTPNATSYVVLTNDLPNREFSFQVAAFAGDTGSEVFSAPSSAITVKSLGSSSFDAPVNLKATAIDDGRCRLSWTDRTTSEFGYQVQFKKGKKGKWEDLVYTNPGSRFDEVIQGLSPKTQYFFRTRAYKGNQVTAFTNTATATTLPFRAPDTLVAKSQGEGNVVLTWKDKSSFESGYELEWKTGDGDFQKLGDVGANVRRTEPIDGFSSNTNYQFRIRAFRELPNKKRAYTAYSKISAVRTNSLIAPTGLVALEIKDSSLRLKWNDNSKAESNYLIQFRISGTRTFSNLASVAANSQEFVVSNLAANVKYDFRVGASNSALPSYSPVISATTLHGLIGNFSPSVTLLKSFLYQLQFSDSRVPSSVTVTGLPPGVVFNASTRTISGIPISTGSVTATITAVFADGSTTTRSLVLTPRDGAPFAIELFAEASVKTGANAKVSVLGKFVDPDTQSAARVITNLGRFDIILFPDSTPISVDNFLNYVDDRRYDDTFFHRAPSDFVVQGGGFGHTPATGFTRVTTFSTIKNEPGISNLRGTVALAKLGGQPNSATSQFFVNLRDSNAASPGGAMLDTQNGGFTVFGRVAGSGMELFDRIDTLPRKDYTVAIGSNSQLLEDVPVNATVAPVGMDASKLVKILTVVAAPVLTYQASSQHPAIAKVKVDAQRNELIIRGVSKGSTTITVKATDLDGKSVSQSFKLTVR